jgi:tRNA-specific 2-thiouridylase
VVALDAARREVIVGPREALLTGALVLGETNWLGDEASIEAAALAARRVLARVRSTRPPAAGRLRSGHAGEVEVVFEVPEEAVSPGQACVLYDAAEPTRLLGGGFIARTTP